MNNRKQMPDGADVLQRAYGTPLQVPRRIAHLSPPLLDGAITSWHAPGQIVSSTWTQVANALVSDGLYALDIPTANHYLNFGDFGFADEVPADATIVQVLVLLESTGTSTLSVERTIRLGLLNDVATSGAAATPPGGIEPANLTEQNADIVQLVADRAGDPLWNISGFLGGFSTLTQLVRSAEFGVSAAGNIHTQLLEVDSLRMAVVFRKTRGHELWPTVRLVPANGVEQRLDLRSVITDARGPTRTRLGYLPQIDRREDINRSLQHGQRGLRLDLRLQFDIITTADQEQLATMLNALLDPVNFAVYLSLNNGLTERRVVLRDWAGPDWLGGKTFAGARYELRLEAVELAGEAPVFNGVLDGSW